MKSPPPFDEDVMSVYELSNSHSCHAISKFNKSSSSHVIYGRRQLTSEYIVAIKRRIRANINLVSV